MLRLKLKDNELCPCGSDKLFSECCKGNPIKINTSRKPPEVQVMERMRASMQKCCMHPDKANCKGIIKKAHALQNNKIISLLAGTERHVYLIDPKKQPLFIPMPDGEVFPIVEMSKTSADKATTETCFCDYHDNVAFAAIEKGAPDFDDNNEEMKFIYAYKTFIFEYYKQWIAFDVFKSNFKDNPVAFQERDMVGMYRMLQLKMKEFEPIKKHYDEQILSGKFDGIFTCAVKIPEQINFANYAYIAPDFDMNGGRIKHTKKGIMHRIAITVFPENSQSWILMSCLNSEKHFYEKLFNQMKSSSVNKIKLYINMMLPLYSENMVLSSQLWNSWGVEIQMAYTYYVNLIGKNAVVMSIRIGDGLKKAARDKTGKVYDIMPKINLFI